MQEMQEKQVWPLGCKGPLEEGMATHSSIPAGNTGQTEESGELESAELQRAGHKWSNWVQAWGLIW